MNKAKLMSILVIPMVNGSISFIASLTIITCIFRSNTKLSTTFRRLIFGLSTFDVLQSLTQALSSVPMPKGTMYFAGGNYTTCDLQAFLAITGGTGAIWYSLSLTIYFLMVIKYNLSDRVITKRYEPFLHGFPILYSLGCSIYTYATQNLGLSGPTCWIAYHPRGCESDPNVDCDNKGPISPDALKWITAGVPFSAVFIVNCVLLGTIWWAVRSQIKKSQAYRHSWVASSPRANDNEGKGEDEEGGNGICSKMTSCISLCTNGTCKGKNSRESPAVLTSPLAARLSRPSQATIKKMQAISNRAFAYIIGYLMTYFFTFVFRIVDMWTTAPFVIILLSRFFFPLQGLFNVLIYTYPHVRSCRRKNEHYSWARAFWEVVKSGGDSDEIRTVRVTRRDSLKKQQRLLEERGQRLSGKIVKNKQENVQKYSLHRVDMSKTRLDNAVSRSSRNISSEGSADNRSNGLSPLYVNAKRNPSHLLHLRQDGADVGEDAASSLSRSHNAVSVSEFSNGGSSMKGSRAEDSEIGSSNSYNPRKVHKEKQEEEEKFEIRAGDDP